MPVKGAGAIRDDALATMCSHRQEVREGQKTITHDEPRLGYICTALIAHLIEKGTEEKIGKSIQSVYVLTIRHMLAGTPNLQRQKHLGRKLRPAAIKSEKMAVLDCVRLTSAEFDWIQQHIAYLSTGKKIALRKKEYRATRTFLMAS